MLDGAGARRVRRQDHRPQGCAEDRLRQANRNLLLSETAIIDTKPQLEIHADDVKCTHGSTIGQLDEEALFYLRSRGIGEEDARELLIYAFASEVVDRMKIRRSHATSSRRCCSGSCR